MSTTAYPNEIIGSKFENNKCFYLVQWKGYKDPTWEPAHHISHRTDLISEYRDMLLIGNLNMKSGGYIYCRVSSKEQSNYNEGHTSLEVQEAEMRKYCLENDINVLGVTREVYSARDMTKLKGLQYLTDIVSPGQKIFVYDISRFSRNAHHALNMLEDLANSKISVVSVTENITYDTPAGKNQFRIQLCSSTYYSDICSQKVKASIAFRRARGDYIGNTPFGYKTEVDPETQVRKKVPCQDELEIIGLIRNMKNSNPSDILDYLTKNNITFRNRKPTCKSIINIIKRMDTDLKISGKAPKKRKPRKKPY